MLVRKDGQASVQTDLIGFVEAAYRLEPGTSDWLAGVLSAARPVLDGGLGVAAYSYDASNPAALRIETFVADGMPNAAAAGIAQGVPLFDADYVRSLFWSLSCMKTSEVPGWHKQRDAVRAREFGIHDSLGMNGMNPDGHGCVLLAPLAQETRLSARRRSILTKLTCHLAAAHRLRRSLENGDASKNAPEAILDHHGKVHHAEGEARSKSALSHLKESAAAIARSRGRLRKSDPEQAVDEWKGLIAARWTLVDVCETDGSRYLVARQNRPETRCTNVLTEREQEVVALAAMGHHNKLIAYNLGISHSTVRVLSSRAAEKLGAASREDLIRRFNLLRSTGMSPKIA
jgi:DNA-binding CsgD family transcriptional regulator